MKFLRRTLTALMGATAIVSLANVAFAEAEVKLRMHQFLPQQANVPTHILDVWVKNVEEASEGRIKIEHFPSMQLGGTPPELYDQAVDGVADIIWTVAGYTPGRFPEAEVFELPFMMTNAEATSKAYWEFAQDTLVNDEMSDTHVLGLWVHGPGIIHSNTPIQTPEDLKGVKLRAPSRTSNILFSNFGAETIGMPVPAVPENLSKGVIDATAIPWEVTASLKTSELVHNHTEFPGASLYTLAFIFTMNKDRYDALPDDLKAIIDENSGLEFSGYAGKIMEEYDAPSRQIAVDLGNNIIELSPEEVENWKTTSQPTIDQWVAEMNEKNIDGDAAIERAMDLIDKYTE